MNKIQGFYLFFFILFELKLLQVKGFVEVLDSDLVPRFGNMSVMNYLQLPQFILKPAPKQPASFLGVISEKILEIILLLIFAIFVQKLNNSQINGLSQSSAPFELTQPVSIIKKTLKHFFCSFHLLHVKVKFVPLIFSFK